MKYSKRLLAIDHSVGTLICHILGAYHKLKARLLPAASESKQPCILMIELFEMGAAAMLAPSLRYVRKSHPESEIHILTTSMCEPIWRELETEYQLHIHSIKTKSPAVFVIGMLRQILSLRKFKFDVIIDYELFFRTSAILSGLLRAKSRSGFLCPGFEGLDRGNFYEFPCYFNQNTHISKNFLALTKTGLSRQYERPNFKGSISTQEVLMPPLQKYAEKSKTISNKILVSVDVGENLAVRNYSLISYASILRDLKAKYPQYRFYFIGTADDNKRVTSRPEGRELLSLGENLMGQTNFKELMNNIHEADLLICNDNGPAHFATLTGTKTVALFSTDSPRMYGPLGDAVIAYSYYHCSPCISAFNHKTTICDNNRCLQSISPSFVTKLIEGFMSGKVDARTVNGRQPYLEDGHHEFQ